jgi:PAS domain S-box-containing protein
MGMNAAKAILAGGEILTERNFANEVLPTAKGGWQDVAEGSAIGIAVADLTGRFVAANSTYQKMLGYTEEELRAIKFLGFEKDPGTEATPIQRLLEGRQQQFQTEKCYRHKDGNYSWIRQHVFLVPGTNTSRWMMAIVEDITDRKRAEEVRTEHERCVALRGDVNLAVASGESLKRILHGCAEAIVRHTGAAFARIWTLCKKQDVLELQASAGMYTHLDGAHARVPVGELKIGLIARERQPHLTNDVVNDPRISDKAWAKREGMVAFAGYPLIVEDRVVGVMAMFSRQQLAMASLEALASVADSIAQGIERKRVEHELQMQKASLDELFEQSPGAFALLDADHRVVRVNREFTRLFGYAREEAVGRSLIDLIVPTELPEEIQRYQELVNSSQRVEAEGIRRRKDGTLLHVSILGVGISGCCGRVAKYAIYQDITERKRLEEKVRESERELRLQTEVIPQHIWSALPDGAVDYSNQGLLTYLGLTMEEMRLVGTSLIHPEDQDRVLRTWQEATSQGTAFEVEARQRGSNGEYRWFLMRALPLRDYQGRIIKWYGTNTDIEVRKRAENELRRSEAYLVEGQRLSHTGSWAWNVSSGEVFMSPETIRILGFDPADTQPSYEMFLERVHPEDRAKIDPVEENYDRETEFRIVLPDSSIRYLHGVGHPVINECGAVTEHFGTVMDVTEQRQARMALEKAYEEISKLKDQLYKENLALREEVDQASMFEEIVGTSPSLQRVLSNVAKVAPTDSTVLIMGETGTGKELIARAIHKRSQRSERAFVTVNCAALPPSLIGSELFGHEKGAFTGALQRRLGRFELAEGGSIFLDEIGELPPETQIALLRILQEREFERIGGGESIAADVRVIAATNRDLKAAAAAGTFRPDLFYRLNVFPIDVPPLRDRLEDLPLLVEYFIGRYANRAGKRIRNIEKRSLELFQCYDWPGNLRELQNVIERSVILCEGETLSVDESWLSRESEPSQLVGLPLAEKLLQQEKEIIESALTASKGRVAGRAGAAAKVGMPPSTLEARIKALKIDKTRFNSA